MQFKGRTVAAYIALTIVATVLLTLMVVDRSLLQELSSRAGLVTAQGDQVITEKLTQEELTKLNTVLSLIETKYYKPVDREQVVSGALNGMMGVLEDPYSVYMEHDAAEHFSESIEGSFTGIGAEVSMENGQVIVVSAIKDSPAERAGLLPKDIILSVNGERLDGLQLSEAVAKVRGPKGSKAELQIQRGQRAQPIQVTVVRDEIDVETVFSEMLPGGIGKIEIRQFAMNTGDRFGEELATLEEQGMKGLIIDVRNNPGGVLPVVVSVTEPFIRSGEPIVQIEDRNGDREQTVSKGAGKPYPLVVLTNKGSASASEVLAGALSERADATIVGETTFGKGTVQVSYNKVMSDGSLVKMTIAKWLTPDGNWINETGIEPDVEVLPPDFFNAPRLSKEQTLKRDMLGEEVRSAQLMLSGLGYSTGRKDGYYSEETAKAVAAFQQSVSLPASGEMDQATAERLEEKLIEWIRDDSNDNQLKAAVEELQKKLDASS
ncbi:S41 family peptidase [Paenibacillus daejeonensis]|uniref:S41 family peptidase n=1 Tax=Paenibacillus daejeonensis TaxID=135193 RepID=UPI000364D598|nr:S41 family peptidase [Paenibacillus daejeonensis]